MNRCEEIANKYGYDAEIAKKVGISHDIAKEIPAEEKLKYVLSYGAKQAIKIKFSKKDK